MEEWQNEENDLISCCCRVLLLVASAIENFGRTSECPRRQRENWNLRIIMNIISCVLLSPPVCSGGCVLRVAVAVYYA